MKCADVIGLLNDRLDQELDADRVRDVESHLKACTECAAEAQALANIKEIVQRRLNRPVAPPELRLRVARAAQPRAALRPRVNLWRAAAAVIVVAGIVSIYVSRRAGTADPSSLAHAEMVRASESLHESYWRDAEGKAWPCKSRSDAERILRDEAGLVVELPFHDTERLQYTSVGPVDVCKRSGVRLFCLLDGKPFSVFVLPSCRCEEMPRACPKPCYCIKREAGKSHVMVCFQRADAYISLVMPPLERADIENSILKFSAQ